MTYKLLLILLGCLAISVASAQVADDFSDGDFTQNPTWAGNGTDFTVNPVGELQLNATTAGAATLAVKTSIPSDAVWDFKFRLEFAPSNQNLFRVYLGADRPDLANANGYFLQMGETGSADAIRFFRQHLATRSELAAGQAGLVATAPVSLHVRVKRTAKGLFTVEAGADAQSLQTQFEVTDTVFGSSCNAFFGVQCVYTTTNKDKFFFDDLSIKALAPDLSPPEPVRATVESETQVRVTFNETLDSLSAVNPVNYSLSGGAIQIAKAVLSNSKTEVTLTLVPSLSSGTHTLTVKNVADCTGNVLTERKLSFQYIKVEPAGEFDLLINEIMSDPTPSVGLPEVEWVEIFNRSGKWIDLRQVSISDDGGSPKPLPTYVLAPDSFVVLCTPTNVPVLQVFTPNVLGVSGFPSLNNAGDLLVLSDAQGTVIDRVAFTLDWHTDPAKEDGGWTLERVDPNTPCLAEENWASARGLPGGSPGRQNSIYNVVPDQAAPRLIDAFPLGPTTLRLTFSEGMDRASAENLGAYQIVPSLPLSSLALSAENRAMALLELAAPLQSGVIYQLVLQTNPVARDCSGNAIVTQDTLRLGLPEKPAPQDVVVNEILFNPPTGGSRYVEFYNRSKKIFSGEHFFLANFQESDIVALMRRQLFLPGAYVVITANPGDIVRRHANIYPGRLLESTLPTLDDQSGNIALYWSKDGETIVVDSFDYQESFHNGLFNSTQRDGVALERIDPESPTNAPSNWTSAAPTVTGAPGTPTLPNSQRRAQTDPTESSYLFLPQSRLSPDGDSFEDFLEIRYQVPTPGFAATMTVFDSEGMPVRRLVRQDLLGTEGLLRWDGDRDDGSLARPGIYVLWLELFHPNGQTERLKKAFALVGKF